MVHDAICNGSPPSSPLSISAASVADEDSKLNRFLQKDEEDPPCNLLDFIGSMPTDKALPLPPVDSVTESH